MTSPPHRLILLLLLTAVIAVSGGLYRLGTAHSEVPFLARQPPAEWIVYPQPPDVVLREIAELRTTFRHTFELDGAPHAARIKWRAYRRAQLSCNGIAVEIPEQESRQRKLVSECDVTALLQPGENELLVSVTNDSGPPALWLTLEGDEWSVRTDSSWQTSLAGAVWRSARLVAAPPDGGNRAPVGWMREPGVAEPSARKQQTTLQAPRAQPVAGAPSSFRGRPERTVESLVACNRALLLFVGIATAAWAGALVARRWLLQVNGIADERRLPPSVAAASAGVAASCWGLLFWNNLPSLCRVLGFDSSAHLDYVQFILDRGELPLAHQGWEMYQPPLYYLIAAAGLKLCGLATHHDSGVMLLRTLNACSGVVQFVLIFASLRLLFPEHPRRQIAGLVLAAFLPLHLYLPHYVTNEALAGVLATASIYLALRCLRQSEPALGVYVGVGLCLGAALLTKFTALVVVPIVLSVLLGQQIIARRFQLRVAVRTVGVTLLVCALASGWHYARVWWHYGKPIVGNWDQASGFRWWQDWGYATAGYYTGFGRSLVDPFFSGLDSLADGIYSTLWGDGLCGGTGGLEFRPPWNYGLVAVGYWLALLPTLCIVVGLARVLIEIVWRPRAEWFLLAGLAGSVGLALVYGSLRLPSFAMAKAFYGLPGMIALGVFGSWGFDLLATRLRRLRPVLWIGLGTWAINSYCSYWIPGNSAETHTMLAHALVLEGRPGQALEHYDAALRVDSRSVNARWGRATALMHLRRDADAVREFEQVLVEAPEHAPARVGLATVLFRGNQLDDAIRQVQQAISSMPNHRSAHFVLAQLLARTGQTGPAIDACREALRVTPGNRQIHRALAELYTQAGDDSAAAEHEQ